LVDRLQFSSEGRQTKNGKSQLSNEYLDQITFVGHENILGLHKNTIEVTKDSDISNRADCIIGVKASKSCADLNPTLKDWIRSGFWVEVEIRTGEHSFKFEGQGSSKLGLTDEKDIVFRRSDYASSRTIALNCSHAACDVPRSMVRDLQSPKALGKIILRPLPHKEKDRFFWSLP
jgi:hypothetical protein